MKPIKLTGIAPESMYIRYRKSLRDYYKNDYNKMWKEKFFEAETLEDQMAWLQYMFRYDLFFMMYYGLNRTDINGFDLPFILQACRKIENGPQTDTVDLWARGHYKSSLITQGKSLQDMFRYDDLSIGFFSHTRPIAKGFLIPVKTALEDNILLKFAFPHKLWENPKKDAKVWSLDEGLELKRSSTSNTRSFEAWGLVDGMPASKHFNIRVYDDVITEKTANSPEMIKKAEDAFRLSDNLGTLSGINWQRIIGTIYNHGDFYCTIIDETKNGAYDWNVRKFVWYQGHYTEEEIIELGISEEYIKVFGYRKPRLLAWDQALAKRKKQGSYIWSCQNELSPSSSEAAEFKLRWLKRYRVLPDSLSLYIFVDPANEKKKTSDYTVVALVGVDQFDNRFLVDMVRDRLDLGERWKAVRDMVNNYPGVKGVFYEKYGKDSDIWYMEQRQLEEGKYFTIEAIGGGTTKTDRIKRFVPICRERKFYLPEKPMVYHGQDLVRIFIDEEYTKFPFCRHDDMLDAISRIEDPAVELIKPTSDTYSPRDMGMIEEYYEQISCDEQI